MIIDTDVLMELVVTLVAMILAGFIVYGLCAAAEKIYCMRHDLQEFNSAQFSRFFRVLLAIANAALTFAALTGYILFIVGIFVICFAIVRTFR